MKRFIPILAVAITLLVSCVEQKPAEVVDGSLSLSLKADKRFLLIPSQENGTVSKLSVVVEGENILGETQNINLAQDRIDYYIPIDIAAYRGKHIEIGLTKVDTAYLVCTGIKTAKAYEYEYDEPYRPIYHFTPDFGWTNDPNGMTYYDGEYHLAYQANPYGTRHFNMHWGNAVSTDLVHWTDLPFIVAPDSLGAIFSGSAIVDTDNTAGFGFNAIVAMYTSASRTQKQSIAYSTDRGRTYTKFEGNPVIVDPDKRNFRDPKLINIDGKWVVCIAAGNVIDFYGSEDLKTWEKLSEFGEGMGSHGGVWECPDLIKLNYNGEEKWVLIVNINPGGPNGGSATQYFIGQFDGTSFTADPLPYPLWLDEGLDDYAGVTFSNTGDRHIFIGWMSNWLYSNDVPTHYFRNAMTMARDLELRDNGEHLFLASVPSPEIFAARKSDKQASVSFNDGKFTVDELIPDNKGAYEVDFTVTPGTDKVLGLKLYNQQGEDMTFALDFENLTITLDRTRSGIVDFGRGFAPETVLGHIVGRESYKIQMFVDKHSTELYINDGDIVFTNTMFPSEVYNSLELSATEGNMEVEDFHIYEIE